jgi:tRNA1(Val) A37 N6-methylase TrmN6
MARLAAEVAALDPYEFMATLGKRVIHPGGRASTEALLARAGIRQASRVLDVGCGVATTPIEIARRYGAHVTAVDIAPLMLERAHANVRAAGVTSLVTVAVRDSARSVSARSWTRHRLMTNPRLRLSVDEPSSHGVGM